MMFASNKAYAQSELSQDYILESLKKRPQIYKLIANGQLNDALTEMYKLIPSNENSAEFYNLLGVLQLRQKNYEAAAATFEKLVLIEPYNAGAWLDLAMATYEAGNFNSAQSYFDYIELNFAPSEAIIAIISEYKVRINKARSPKKKWQSTAEISVGTDTNANSGLQASIIPITFGTDRVDLPLDPNYKARQDSFVQGIISTRYRNDWKQSDFNFGVVIKKRHNHSEHAYSTMEVMSQAGILSPTSIGVLGVNVVGHYSELGTKALLGNYRISSTLERSWQGCRYGLGVEFEKRRYISVLGLNANVLWGQLGGACEGVVYGRVMQAAIIFRSGLDKPSGLRAGGLTHRKEILYQLSTKLPMQLIADISYSYSTAFDSEGYSALLENNAAREITRNALRIQLSKELSNQSSVFIKLEKNEIHSNIALFVQSAKSVAIGVQQRF